jgi:hypothetical protein
MVILCVKVVLCGNDYFFVQARVYMEIQQYSAAVCMFFVALVCLIRI